MMEKRKPKDEDYVPGRGQYRDSPYGSPLPDDASPDLDVAEEIKTEEPLGEDAARLAADDLERELAAELGLDGAEGAAQRPEEPKSDGPRGDRALTPLSYVAASLLPPRPVDPGAPAVVPRAQPIPVPAVSDAFKRGLAGLPKRPDF